MVTFMACCSWRVGAIQEVSFGGNNTQELLNRLLTLLDAPQIVFYDGSYDSTSTQRDVFRLSQPEVSWRHFCPKDCIVVIGQPKRDYPIGEYCVTKNVNNPDLAPGAYTRLIRWSEGNIELHDGHSGSPVLYLADSVAVIRLNCPTSPLTAEHTTL